MRLSRFIYDTLKTAGGVLLVVVLFWLMLFFAGLGCASRQAVVRPMPTPALPLASIVEPPPAPEELQAGEDVRPSVFWATACLPIYFDFDRSSIRPDQRPMLQQNAALLKGGNGNVVIEGYCDERGTVEYNIALGEQRGLEVAQALKRLGVSPGRLAVVSYGKEKAEGHDEEGWARDRRAEVKLLD